jgi:hypothetical protein
MSNIIGLNGKSVETTVEAKPEYKTYTFLTRNGDEMTAEGYMAVTGAWVGVGRGDGDIQLIVPLDNLHAAFVHQTETN